MNELLNVKIETHNGKPMVSSRQVAENFEKEHRNVLDSIRAIVFEIGCAEKSADPLFIEHAYIHSQNNQRYPEYLMNRDGFTLLAMGFTGEKALQWKLKYIQAFNEMEQKLNKPMSQLELLAAMAQEAANLEKRVHNNEKQITTVDEKVDSIKNLVGINVLAWRKDTQYMVFKIAQALGGNEHMRAVYQEAYQLLDERFQVSLKTRVTRKRQRLALDGVCKSKLDKINQLDVIADDKKLIEGYVMIIKELAIKYGVCETLETKNA